MENRHEETGRRVRRHFTTEEERHEARKETKREWQRAHPPVHQKRLAVNLDKDDYENRILPAIDASGMSISDFVKAAIDEKIINDGPQK